MATWVSAREQRKCWILHYSYLVCAQLANGNMFDSSRDRGKPFKFKLGGEQVIPGLDAGVLQLSIGERAKILIPPDMAYGTLLFDLLTYI